MNVAKEDMSSGKPQDIIIAFKGGANDLKNCSTCRRSEEPARSTGRPLSHSYCNNHFGFRNKATTGSLLLFFGLGGFLYCFFCQEVSAAKSTMTPASRQAPLLRAAQMRGEGPMPPSLGASGNVEGDTADDAANGGPATNKKKTPRDRSLDIFGNPGYIEHEVLQSDREDFINKTELLNMELTDVPSMSPNESALISSNAVLSSPTPTRPPASHQTDDIIDDAPRRLSENPSQEDEDARKERDFFEFIAFVCWYAFLILCCLLPTACAYHRRRRNARVLREQLRVMQQTQLVEALASMGEQGGNGVGGGVNGGLGSGNGGMDWDSLPLGEDSDWVQLEQRFGAGNTGGNANGSFIDGGLLNSMMAAGSANRRRDIMLDILGGMSVRVVAEREERRRRERGRRLVAALKETSVEVTEYNLIPKEESSAHQPNNTNQAPPQSNVGPSAEVEGDIEMGEHRAVESIPPPEAPPETSESPLPTAKLEPGAVSVNEKDSADTATVTVNPALELESPSEASHIKDIASDDPQLEATVASDDPQLELTVASEPNQSSPTPLTSPPNQAEPIPSPQDFVPHDDTPQSTPSPMLSRLYEVNDFDDDDDDNRYSALSIPIINPTAVNCSNQSGDTANPDGLINPNALDNTAHRLVPATCAICLVHYTPGTYVSWSSNQECVHAFHRDCILVWLLKKEEPLCPCCRREFVLNSILTGDHPGMISGGGGINANSNNGSTNITRNESRSGGTGVLGAAGDVVGQGTNNDTGTARVGRNSDGRGSTGALLSMATSMPIMLPP